MCQISVTNTYWQTWLPLFPSLSTWSAYIETCCFRLRYDTIEEFKVDWKAKYRLL